MRRETLCISLIICLSLAAGCKSPTVDNDPARIEIMISPNAYTFQVDTAKGVWWVEFVVSVYDYSDVGATITEVRIEWVLNGTVVASTSHSGGTVNRRDRLDVPCRTECPTQYKPNQLRFRILGKDNHNYTIDRTVTLENTW